MKRKISFILVLILILGLFSAPSVALALGEPWEHLSNIPDGPQYDHMPYDVAIDSSGNIYIADILYDRIKRYTEEGILDTSWCGDGILGGKTGSAPSEFDVPRGIALDANDNLYVADTDNNRIKKYTSEGVLDINWGSGGIIGSEGSGDTQFNEPHSVAVDSSGNLYVADTINNRIKRYTSAGVLDISWGGGDGIIGSEGSGNDELRSPRRVDVDGSDNLYIADFLNGRVKRYTSAGVLDTTWGGGDGIINGTGGAGDGQSFHPLGIAMHTSGILYVMDVEQPNQRVLRYTSAGILDTSWGGGDGFIGSPGTGDGQFLFAVGGAVDMNGNLYVADGNNMRVHRFTSSGDVDTAWCNGGLMNTYGSHADDFHFPYGAAADSSGNIYIADTANNRIKRYTKGYVLDTGWGGGDGIIGGVQGSGADDLNQAVDVAVDTQDNLYVLDFYNYRIKRYTPQGDLDTSWAAGGMITETQGSGAEQMANARGITVDTAGNIYIADKDNNRIKRYTSSGTLDTAWCSGGILGGTLGSGADQFDHPQGLVVDAAGNLYVTDSGNDRIKRYSANGELDLSWCSGGILGGTQGSDIDQFDSPTDITVNPATEEIYIAESGNHRIIRYAKDGTSPECILQAGDSREDTDASAWHISGLAFFEGRLYYIFNYQSFVKVLCDVENGLKLGDLSMFGETVSGFDSETREYTVVVSKNATTVEIEADPLYAYSSVSGTGTKTLSSANSTQFKITVTAENGSTQDYTLNVLRDGEDVGLSDLAVDGQTISGFSQTKTSYTITAPYGARYIDIGATGNSYCEEITGTGVVKLTGDTTQFSVVAKALDGSAKEYTLTINKGGMDTSWINAAIDGKSFGSSGICLIVPEGGKTVMLRITLADGTYADFPISLTAQGSDDTDTGDSDDTQTNDDTDKETIPVTGDTLADAPFIVSVDGVEAGESIKMDVPQSGQTIVLTIEMPDGSVYDLPVELIPQSAAADSAADVSEDSIPLTPSGFAWWWILIGVLGAGLAGMGVWVVLLKKRL